MWSLSGRSTDTLTMSNLWIWAKSKISSDTGSHVDMSNNVRLFSMDITRRTHITKEVSGLSLRHCMNLHKQAPMETFRSYNRKKVLNCNPLWQGWHCNAWDGSSRRQITMWWWVNVMWRWLPPCKNNSESPMNQDIVFLISWLLCSDRIRITRRKSSLRFIWSVIRDRPSIMRVCSLILDREVRCGSASRKSNHLFIQCRRCLSLFHRWR